MLNVDIEVLRERIAVAVAVEVEDGETVGVFGTSGAGKSTLLDAVAGLVPIAAGRIDHGSRCLSRAGPDGSFQLPLRHRRVGYLRQRPGLFPHLDVEGNISYSAAARHDGAGGTEELIDRLELSGLRRAMPATLSGGQARRVALARALAADSLVLLADEPFSGLDGRLRRVVGQVLVEAARRRRAPLLVVAHELADAQAFCDRLVVLEQGKVLQVGDPHEIVRRPSSVAVARLVGYTSFVRVGGGLLGVHPQMASVVGTCGAHSGDGPGEAAQGVGPLGERGMLLQGVVRSSRPADARWECSVDVAGVAVACMADERPPPDGSRVEVALRSAPAFGGDGRALQDGPGAGAVGGGWMQRLCETSAVDRHGMTDC
ncbi:MAG: ATP-binding cassette domain-containing protein [Actinomycetota bacterium]|nr:ATP-binding cassette domain-containing protein [Actinomycetota bacterium]